MTDSPIQYRLIKKEKHTGARLGEIITPHLPSLASSRGRLGRKSRRPAPVHELGPAHFDG